jgi:hypothetical protein
MLILHVLLFRESSADVLFFITFFTQLAATKKWDARLRGHDAGYVENKTHKKNRHARAGGRPIRFSRFRK